jgi:hypothetical protein
MSVVFKRGQILGRSEGLNIFLKAKDGTVKNAATITYDVYDFTTGVEVLCPPQVRTPANPTVGEYFAQFQIPLDANLGKYRIRWKFQDKLGGVFHNVVQDFAIVAESNQIVTLPGVTAIQLDLIRAMRIMLRDNNPARNYHFLPPTNETSTNQFNRVFGYLWEDGEILEYLNIGNDLINMYPPQTSYATIDQLINEHRSWRTLLLTGSMIHALQAITLNNIAEEFGYSIGGVSLDIEKSSKYQSMMSEASNRFNEMVASAKKTVLVIRGLKQSRYGIGIRSSFGPSVGRGTLTPRRFLGV